MSAPACPSCGTEVQPDWDWCYKCGFDPDGRRPAAVGATAQVGAPSGPTVSPPRPDLATPPPQWGAPVSYGPPKQGSGANVALLAIGVIVILVLGAGAFLFVGRASSTSPTTTLALADPTPTVDPWKPFTPPGGGFTVEIPGTPTDSPEQLNLVTGPTTMHVFESSNPQHDVGIGYFDMPPDATFRIDRAVDLIANSKGGVASDRVPVDYAGNKAVDVTVTATSGAAQRVRLRTLIVGQRVYFLLALGPPNRKEEIEADFVRLTNSLKIG